MNRITFATALALGFCRLMTAQVSYTGIATADAFLATGSPGNPEGSDLTGLNFGGAGALVVASKASEKGEFQSLLRFQAAGAVTLFNDTYGTNNWTISDISLELTSNYGTDGVQPNNAIFPRIHGGNFVVEWLATDAWVEGTGMPNLPTTDGVTYNSLPGLLSGAHEILGTNSYTPPGNNIPVTYSLPLNTNLVADVVAGGDVNFLFFAADDQIGYLFNSYFYGRGNEPRIHVTARPPTLEILSANFTNAVFQLTGRGAANQQYQIQATTNLVTTNWFTIGTATATGNGLVQFGGSVDPGRPARFYRLAR